MKLATRNLRRRTEAIGISMLTLVLVAAIGVVSIPVGSAASARPLVVHITIWPNLDITVAPRSIRRGTVLLSIRNRDKTPHAFSINGVETNRIAPHKLLRVRVKFKKPDMYAFTLPGYVPTPETGWKAVGGVLKVT
jgi:hypothetical protein